MSPAPVLLHTLTRRLDSSDWDTWGKWAVIGVGALIVFVVVEET